MAFLAVGNLDQNELLAGGRSCTGLLPSRGWWGVVKPCSSMQVPRLSWKEKQAIESDTWIISAVFFSYSGSPILDISWHDVTEIVGQNMSSSSSLIIFSQSFQIKYAITPTYMYIYISLAKSFKYETLAFLFIDTSRHITLSHKTLQIATGRLDWNPHRFPISQEGKLQCLF